MDPKIKTYVGFAIRSGNCIFGYDAILKSTKVKCVLISTSISEKQTARLIRDLDELKIAYRSLSPEDMKEYVCREGVKAIGIKDPNLASAIIDRLDA